jgi:GAF domain-containing protein
MTDRAQEGKGAQKDRCAPLLRRKTMLVDQCCKRSLWIESSQKIGRSHNAVRICGAKFGTMYRYDGDMFQPTAVLNAPPTLSKFLQQRGAFQPPSGTPLDRLLQTKSVVHSADDSTEEVPSPSAKLGGARSHIAVPMLSENEVIGAIIIYRQEIRPDVACELPQPRPRGDRHGGVPPPVFAVAPTFRSAGILALHPAAPFPDHRG